MARLQSCFQASTLFLASITPTFAAEPTRPAAPISESQSLIIENSNLSGKELLTALTSANLSERRHAEMYLLGVLDATEQIAWCDYKKLKTITLDEAVYTGLKKLSEEELGKRASTLVAGILHKRFPCKGNDEAQF
jgi:hypothetical protein